MDKIALSLSLNNFLKKKDADSNSAQIPAANFPKQQLSLQKDEVSFTGLSRKLSKKAYEDAKDIKELAYFSYRSKGIVGNLMHELVEKIPKTERASKIKELYASLKVAVKNFREEGDVNSVEEKINAIFKKAGLISDKENIELNYIDSGAMGAVYHLKGISDNKYVIKFFHQINCPKISEKKSSKTPPHGNYIEPNRAIFWQKRAGVNTQKVRFYFGDVNAGYMVNKYIPENAPVCKNKTVPEHIHGLVNSDTEDYLTDGHNRIRGYDSDFGGINVLSSLSENKTASYVYKKIFQAQDKDKIIEMSKFLGMKKYRNNPDVKLGIAHSIKLLNRETDIIPYFDAALEKPNNQIKSALSQYLRILPKERTYEYFNKLLKNSDTKIIEKLTYSVHFIKNMEQRIEAFDKLSRIKDGKTLSALSEMLFCLPRNKQVEYFDKILQHADSDTKNVMLKTLRALDGETAIECFKKLHKNADEDFKIALAKGISLLAREKRVEAFDEVMKYADNDIKMEMINIIPQFEEKELPYVFDRILERANDEIKNTLKYRIDYLPINVRTAYREKCTTERMLY